MVFICTSLMSNGGASFHALINQLCIFSCEVSKSFAIFFNQVVFLLLTDRNCLYFLDLRPGSDGQLEMSFAKCGLPFHFLNSVFG